VLEVSFVRRRGSRDRVYVSRADGTTVDWAFPSYGDGLPHDLCHLVVEQALGLTEGFWGLVDQGVDVGLVNNEATLLRDGRPLTEHLDADFAGLVQAEAAVASFGSPMHVTGQDGALAIAHAGTEAPADGATRHDLDLTSVFGAGVELPATATPDAIAAIRTQLRELGQRWRTLDDGGAITLTFTRGARTGS
jgi:hypothetical protein